MKAETVIAGVLRKITPSVKERRETEAVLERIRKATRDALKPLKLEYTLAGSFLRDTWLPDKKEFDIFILFPESVSRQDLEEKGLEIGKAIVRALGGSHEIAYAEHPYIRADVDGYAVDFVPCYDIKEPGRIKSAVDRTPHHNRYILANLTGSLPSEVRLLKQFCKGIGVYGSDLCVEGFSGYLTELLVIKYGTFKNVLLSAAGWEAGSVFIDLGRHHKTKPDLRDAFPGQPLVVIDPVDRKRNVAAALSPANFEKFRARCASFLKSPAPSYFSKKRTVMKPGEVSRLMKSRGTRMLAVVFERPDVVDDVIYPQMRRSAKRLTGMMEDNDFRVLGSGVWCGDEECCILLELEVWSLPSVRKVIGPPVFARKHSEEFMRKYSGSGRLCVVGDAWLAEVRRRYTDALELLQSTVKSKKSTLRSIGVASYVADGLGRGVSVLSGNSITIMMKKEGFPAFLTEYFKNKVV